MNQEDRTARKLSQSENKVLGMSPGRIDLIRILREESHKPWKQTYPYQPIFCSDDGPDNYKLTADRTSRIIYRRSQKRAKKRRKFSFADVQFAQQGSGYTFLSFVIF